MRSAKQLPLSFEGSLIKLAGAAVNVDRIEFVEAERLFPSLAGKMRKIYGPRDDRTCGECRNYAGRTAGCQALAEGRKNSGWDPSWPACGAFDIQKERERLRLRLALADKAAGR